MPFRIGVLKRFVVDHGSFSPGASTVRGVYEFTRMHPQEGTIMQFKGLYFSLLLGFVFGLLANLGNLAALNLGLAKPDAHAAGSVAGRVEEVGAPGPPVLSASAA